MSYFRMSLRILSSPEPQQTHNIWLVHSLMSKNCTKLFQLPDNNMQISQWTTEAYFKVFLLGLSCPVQRGFFLFKKLPPTSLFYVLLKHSFKDQRASAVFWHVHFKESSWSSTSRVWLARYLHRTAVGKYADRSWKQRVQLSSHIKLQIYQLLVSFNSIISHYLNLHLCLSSCRVQTAWICLFYPSLCSSSPH